MLIRMLICLSMLLSACVKSNEIFILISVTELQDSAKVVNDIVAKHGLIELGRITSGPIDDYLFESEKISRFRVSYMPNQIAFDSTASEYSAALLNEICAQLTNFNAVVDKIEGDLSERDVSKCVKLKR